MSQTLSYIDDREDGERERALIRAPQLVIAMDCASPCARPARFSLHDVDEVVLGRGPARNRVRVREGAVRRLRIHLPDAFMSSRHLRLFRRDGCWHAEDAGSKNGTFVGEERLSRARLADGDLVVAGSTLLAYRSEMEVFDDEIDLDLTGTAHADAATATVDAGLARELARLMRIARSQVPVLIHGPTGTGKELVARAVHAGSGRRGPLVAVNCGALPPTLIVSELFGVRKGAYSGATEDRTGFVRAADGGTLFLDEIGELPMEAQAALLRVLQENAVVPLGASRAIAVDVKVIAATLCDLPALVERGEFREDLFARVAGYEMTLPPLCDRREDIGLVIGTLLERDGRTGVRFAPEAARALFTHAWPRNIRELEHVLASALAVAGDDQIRLEHLPESVRAPESPPAKTSDEPDVAALLREHRGNVSAVARALGTSRSQVRRLATRLGLDIATFRS